MELTETKQMFLYLSQKMIGCKKMLTQADKNIGDGDHGIGMAKGFEAVTSKLENQEFETLGALFKTVGFAMMSSMGGASGAIFGTLFQGCAAALNECKQFDAKALNLFLVEGLAAVQKRGKAKPGDKTMVDALAGAASASKDQVEASFEVALRAATEGARLGMERTKDMIASIGRAKTLGDRVIGFPDPGAVSTHLILSFMLEYIEEKRR